MVPMETQEVTDSLPKAQSKSGSTQLDGPGMVSSANIPEVLTEDMVCDTVMPPVSVSGAASLELPLNVEEAPLIREESNRTSHDADAILVQEFSSRFPDHASILDIQGSARSDQRAQGTGCPPSSSVPVQNITTAAEHWTSTSTPLVNHSEDVVEGGVQPPNVLHSRLTVNASAVTSLPNNHMGQSPRLHLSSFSDICDHELEKLSREQGTLLKSFEETTLELKAELERKMAEARSEYDRKSQEVDAAYNAQAKKNEALRSLVVMNSLLANAYKSTCPVKSAATDTATVRAPRSSQHSTQQQQAVQTNRHMNSTAPPRPSVTAAEPMNSAAPPRPSVTAAEPMNSTAPPRPSVTAAEATPPNLSAPLPHCNTPQPSPISQQAAVESNTQMQSTALPRPSVTAEARPLHQPHSNTPQPRPIPQKALVQANTDINSTALPRPLVTAEAPPLHQSSCKAPQPKPISQQPAVQSKTDIINSTALPRPSVTTEARPLHQPRSKTPQPKPVSQPPAKQSNTEINSTPHPRPSVTSKAISLQSPPCNTPQPRPPPLISNHTPTSYQPASAPPVHGIARRTMAPHLRSSRAPNSAAAPSTYPRLAQEQQKQQQKKSNSSLVYLSDDD
ncbi:ATP-dependent helicase family protein [Arabidopsis thaliana]|uniref:ATP-dependent helicase family protein n=1 Tax=Arabidopsis thaliana TaxID=3702 RepID=A0A1P8B130_ARATH|nr:ATP-dependent helicase family protein [Arabidopsis thaliana]ANM62615.1 ATP-dependent helicase family protein [Arabidopsis thaliana]|eukprot:NP_001324761.1 ATP-dependent helicase family protein [Arabidopsis thaliana]